MKRVAQEAGMSRESLYRALGGKGNPEFATVVRVMQAMGLGLGASITA
jgi:probable addiction module antidote protein